MKRFFIEDVKCGITEGGFACGPVGGNVVVTIQFKEEGKTQWLSLVEVDGIPNVFLFDKDVHDELVKEDFDNEQFTKYMGDHSIHEFNGIELNGDYRDAFGCIDKDPDNPAVPVVRYLITLVRCDMDDVEELISMAIGKYADELDIPESDVEEDYYDDGFDDEEEYDDEEFDLAIPDDISKEDLYRMRLALETDLVTESVYHDIEGEEFEQEAARLQAVKDSCDDENDYEVWKEKYILEQFEKLKEKKFITCTYLFAGIGQYEEIIPKEEKESLICWINGNGSASFGGERESTDDEIKKYIALHSNDEE